MRSQSQDFGVWRDVSKARWQGSRKNGLSTSKTLLLCLATLVAPAGGLALGMMGGKVEYFNPMSHALEYINLMFNSKPASIRDDPRWAKLSDPKFNPVAAFDENAMLSLERTPSEPTDLYRKPWSDRWRSIRKLGEGGFGEAWLLQSRSDNALAVGKFAPHPSRKGDYVRWGDYNRGNTELDVMVKGMAEECAWAYYLQKFGVDFRYATRFMFMQCWETNIAPNGARNHPQDNHELYLIVNFAGKQLNELEFKTVPAAANILQQLTNSLHYMKLAGLVHHDIKGPNILYSENVDAKGQTAGGHIVVIDFGAMMPADATTETSTDGPFTPGYFPPGFQEKQNINPLTSFDVFSMGGVIGEVLCGWNFLYSWIGMTPPHVVDWFNMYATLNDPSRFRAKVLEVAATVDQRKERDGDGPQNRAAVLQGLIAEYPHFLELWRAMFSQDAPKRDEAAHKMWRMFLYHGDEKEAQLKQEEEWNNMLLQMPRPQREQAIKAANKVYRVNDRVQKLMEYENNQNQPPQGMTFAQNPQYQRYAGHANAMANQLYQDRHQQMQGNGGIFFRG